MKKEISALDAATKFIGYKERTEAEIIIKLQSLGYNQNETEETITRLKENLMLDDTRYATDYAECLKKRKISKNKARLMLKAKKLDGQLIDEVLETFSDESEQENADNEAITYIKKVASCPENGFEYSNLACKSCMNKTLRRLVSRNFDFEVAKSAARRACEQYSEK
ncbi:MAG: hypothetical protein GX802_00435 [Clostridiales bacterium]|nr:hypothetical protein [Clostridiales bacterium]